MTKERLSSGDRDLLQRFYDGELGEFEARRAKKLIESHADARDFVAGLQEVGDATRVAEEEAWAMADAPAAASVVELATAREDEELSLVELAPLLDRFFDGETTEEESEFVAELIDTREEVADYIVGLESLRAGVLATSEAASDVDFGGFWDSLAARIDDEVDANAYDADEHHMLIHRFHDGEVDDAEIATVHAWVDGDVDAVTGTLDALAEMKLAVTAGIEEAQEGVDFSSIWAAVEDAMDSDLEAKGENVVALGKARRQKEEHKTPFVMRYSQGLAGAVAALFLVVFAGGIFNEQLFGTTEKVIVEKTVVIVDSVEYAPGASVMINSPVQEASAISNPDSDNEEPTVIWLLDSGDESLEDADAPAIEAAPDVNEEPADDEPDAGRRTKQQPI